MSRGHLLVLPAWSYSCSLFHIFSLISCMSPPSSPFPPYFRFLPRQRTLSPCPCTPSASVGQPEGHAAGRAQGGLPSSPPVWAHTTRLSSAHELPCKLMQGFDRSLSLRCALGAALCCSLPRITQQRGGCTSAALLEGFGFQGTELFPPGSFPLLAKHEPLLPLPAPTLQNQPLTHGPSPDNRFVCSASLRFLSICCCPCGLSMGSSHQAGMDRLALGFLRWETQLWASLCPTAQEASPREHQHLQGPEESPLLLDAN